MYSNIFPIAVATSFMAVIIFSVILVVRSIGSTRSTDSGQSTTPAAVSGVVPLSSETSAERMRGFEIVSGYENRSVLPARGTRHSAAYDLFSPEDVTLKPGESFALVTGIKAYMQPDEVLLLFIRSSLGKKDLELKNKVAVIDSDFYGNASNEGNITLMLRNTGMATTDKSSPPTIEIKKGDKIAQGLFVNYLMADGDHFDGANSRTGGIGSTGE